jgi:hypothetical protein
MTKSTMGNKAPHPPAILINMAVRLWDAKRIARCSMPRATPEATGRRHWRLLTPYCPSGHQGDNQQNDDAKYPPFAGHFDGRGGAPVLYCAHCSMEAFYGFHKSH